MRKMFCIVAAMLYLLTAYNAAAQLPSDPWKASTIKNNYGSYKKSRQNRLNNQLTPLYMPTARLTEMFCRLTLGQRPETAAARHPGAAAGDTDGWIIPARQRLIPTPRDRR